MAGANAQLTIDSILDLQTYILPNLHLTMSRPPASAPRPFVKYIAGFR
jgi:hypothetical protein